MTQVESGLPWPSDICLAKPSFLAHFHSAECCFLINSVSARDPIFVSISHTTHVYPETKYCPLASSVFQDQNLRDFNTNSWTPQPITVTT